MQCLLLIESSQIVGARLALLPLFHRGLLVGSAEAANAADRVPARQNPGNHAVIARVSGAAPTA